MQEIQTEILINAPIEKIWATLTDFESYSLWNPFIRKIDGILQLNNQLAITIQPDGKKPMIFRPKIISCGNYEFSWMGRFFNTWHF